MIVSPRSASSRTVAKLRDASVAVITFMKSDYLIPVCSLRNRWTTGLSSCATAQPARRNDTPMGADNVRRSWGAIRRVASLDDMRFHDLRHTCVPLLLNLGVPPQVVRDIVGHNDIKVTMTIYAHVSLDEKRSALTKLGSALT
ncbi:tyrosine-type recombinase/integrase [Streptosporangium canum]|uniref:tyrosine-type recombinase/integrase n=1 Tax=Streptosporangium canum TaxID=324952 RepID=UPI00379C589B